MSQQSPKQVATWLRYQDAANEDIARTQASKCNREAFEERARMLRAAAVLIEQAHGVAPVSPFRHRDTP